MENGGRNVVEQNKIGASNAVGEKNRGKKAGEGESVWAGKCVGPKTGEHSRNAQVLGVGSLFLLGMVWVGWRVGWYGLRMWYDTL